MDSIFKALSDETRREIIKLLSKHPRSAGEIGSNFPITAPSLSRHLSILTASGLISPKRQGRNKLYMLNKSYLQEFLLAVYNYFEV